MIPCAWKQTTGLDCPGCGMQRSVESMLQGEVTESFIYFPALVPFIALIVLAILHLLNPNKFKVKWVLYSMFLTAGLMLGNWIFKMF